MRVAVSIGRATLAGSDHGTRGEWLVTNGIGGYASGTVGFLNTRRYHGLLVASRKPPAERVVMVAKLDASVTYWGVRTALATNEYADGTIDPHGHRHLDSVRLEGQHPVWTWVIGDAVLEQRIWMAQGRNTTYIRYHVMRASAPVDLELRPLCTYRDYHSLRRGRADVAVSVCPDGLEVRYPDAQPYRICVDNGTVTLSPDWYWNFKHREESARGLDELEDLLAPAIIRLSLAPGATSTLVLSSEAGPATPAEAALAAEIGRQRQLLTLPRRITDTAGRGPSDWEQQLVLAADQFIVDREDAGGARVGKTVIAGYPWFSDWGRDTMIALPGLTLATGRFEVAAGILRTFAGFLSEGMLPNRFPDGGEPPEYNTADATLWFFVAVDEYVRASGDVKLRKELYPALKEAVSWHLRGTRYGIGVDSEDGLLRAGVPGVQLTWMDAKVGDWVVTARIGKCVELNALWYNALNIMRGLAEQESDPDGAHEYGSWIDRLVASFEQRFWFAHGGHLYDVIDGPEGELDGQGRRCDPSLRPNQLFAVSLRYPLLHDARARSVVDVCARELWTPVGLRSLAAVDPRFTPVYRGSPRDRDGAYHQGTVWSWLLGPFALAHFRAHGDAALARSYLTGFESHLREACLGQVSEIFDGTAPFTARGCYAQAWAVGEILRAWRLLNAR
jgi:predicted glycogen debranching enzyme